MRPPDDRLLVRKRRIGRVFELACLWAAACGCLVLAALLASVVWQAWGWLTWDFLTRYDSRFPEQAGIKAAIWGSFWVLLFTAVVSVPIGVGTAVYLEEFAAPPG